MKGRVCFLFLLLCLGCSHKPKAPTVSAGLVDSGRSVRFTGLDYAIVSELGRDSSKGIWQVLIPVFRMPADTDLKTYQPVQPGTYKLIDSAIVFTPDTPFVKGHAYFMRYYRFSGNDNMWDYIRGKSKLGRVPYTDLVFNIR
jgi:hypothetical protein